MGEEQDNEELKGRVFIMDMYMLYEEMMTRKSGGEVQQMIPTIPTKVGRYTKVGWFQVGRNLEGERRGR